MNVPKPAWRTADGPDADVVVSTRCRIARNLAGVRFPWRADRSTRRAVADAVVRGLRECGAPWTGCAPIQGDALAPALLRALLDERYVSREWAAGSGGQALILSDATELSALVNEEDHIRVQCLMPGLQVGAAYRAAADTVERLGAHVRYARDEEFGYLTSSPANAGSGIRVSVWMHVPGLALDGRLGPVLNAAVDLGSCVRGAHGEGTHGTGELFQLSNTWADARSVERAVERLRAAAAYVVEEERTARAVQFGGTRGQAALRDAAEEALGLLEREDASPRRLLQLASVLRLAVAEGVLPGRLRDTAQWLAVAGGFEGDVATVQWDAAARSAALRRLALRSGRS